MKSLIYELCRWTAAAAVILFLMIAGGQNSKISNADPQDVLKSVCEAADMTALQPASNQIVKRLYGINPADYEFCALYYPLTNMDVDEILLIRLSDSSQEQVVRNAADARITGQKKAFESYGVGQMELMNNHSFYEAKSGFVLFVINSGSDEIHAAFITALEGE